MPRWVHILTIACWLTGLAAAGVSSGPARSDFNLRAGILINGIDAKDEGDRPVTVGSGGAGREKSVVRGMLLSALLPGLGEIYADGTRGHVSGAVMAATDVFSVWQYFTNNGKGDDWKQDYQRFARAHYDRDSLGAYIRGTIAVYSGTEALGRCRPGPTYDPVACSVQVDEIFPLSKTNDDDFYLQIGTEDRYIFGWDDWNTEGIENPEVKWTGWNPGDPIPVDFQSRSARRVEYQGMRDHADDFYSKADRYAWVMVIGRVISIVDTAILVKLRNRDLAGVGTNPRLSLKVDLLGRPDFRMAIKVRF
ncbi:MAG: hypothetical protein V1694_06665 [Candidatus Eisenbacteria bacterium]